jgi:hypothetical protein
LGYAWSRDLKESIGSTPGRGNLVATEFSGSRRDLEEAFVRWSEPGSRYAPFPQFTAVRVPGLRVVVEAILI